MTEPALNTHGLVIEVGKYAGKLYTRLPVSYLRWMVTARHVGAPIAQAELDRRGVGSIHLDISQHAVDRASLVALDLYLALRKPEEGLHAWLCRIAEDALATVTPQKDNRYTWGPLQLVIATDLEWPVVVTVIYNPKAAGVPKASAPDHPGRQKTEA